jgi:hypothetical protein
MATHPGLASTVEPWLDHEGDGTPPDFRCASLRLSRECGDDAFHVLSYLRGLGARVTSLDDLEAAVAALVDEEELSAVRVREGVLVRHASDGWFLLFVE